MTTRRLRAGQASFPPLRLVMQRLLALVEPAVAEAVAYSLATGFADAFFGILIWERSQTVAANDTGYFG